MGVHFLRRADGTGRNGVRAVRRVAGGMRILPRCRGCGISRRSRRLRRFNRLRRLRHQLRQQRIFVRRAYRFIVQDAAAAGEVELCARHERRERAAGIYLQFALHHAGRERGVEQADRHLVHRRAADRHAAALRAAVLRGGACGFGKDGKHPASGKVSRLAVIGQGDVQHVPRVPFHHGKCAVGDGTADVERDFKLLQYFCAAHMPLPPALFRLGLAAASSAAYPAAPSAP